MSLVLAFNGTESVLSSDFNPPIELDSSKSHSIGLIDFYSNNSIPNVDEGENKFYIGDQILTIPTGQYEIEDLNDYVQTALNIKHDDEDSDAGFDEANDYDESKTESKTYFSLYANGNTLKTVIKSSFKIDFTQDDCIRRILGFDKCVLKPQTEYESQNPANVFHVNVIKVNCNLATGSYKNGVLVHTIHEFFPQVEPGYKIVEVPRSILYLPTNAQTIYNITVNIVDQENRLVNFRGEEISLRLELNTK